MDVTNINFDLKERLAKNFAVIDEYKINDESIRRLSERLTQYSRAVDNTASPDFLFSYEDVAGNIRHFVVECKRWSKQYDHTKQFDEFWKYIGKPRGAFSDAQIERLMKYVQIDVNRLKVDKKYQRDQYANASNLAFDIANEKTEADGEIITEEDLKDAYDRENRIGFQEWFYNKSEAFRKKYYVYALIIDFILFLLGTLIGIYLTDALAKGTVKEEPAPQTTVIYNITEETNVTIIGEVNYYYQITFEDENGNEITGYIAKKNVKLLPIEDMPDGE